MDTMEAENATLYDLLGRHWSVGAPVTNVVFDAAGEAVAFALADGSLAIAPLIDSEPPKDRCRIALDGGRSTISPRRNPVPPLTKVVISDSSLHLASIEPSGFIASDRSQLLHVSAAGVRREAAKFGTPIDLVASVNAGGVLAASGGAVIYYDSNGDVGWLQERAGGSSSAMAVSPDGRSFAIGTDGCLLVRAFGPRPEPVASFALGAVSILSWSPDGSWLATSLAEAGIVLLRLSDLRTVRICSYPASVTSLSWSADSRFLVTSGAYRIIAWDAFSLDDGGEQPTSLGTGCGGFVLVETVNMHPGRRLVAAGYSDGRVVVARIGEPDELVVKPPGRSAVQALRWSDDGQHLAVGTRGGEAAIVTFPPQIFK
ncbi:WD40 repeat domain-containing protein (plasmid) [Bradyrhizobium sp. CB82]|uniref:WD40 repeat domain-containing protein n=1 Tax=Bradyrhizobium sp. CB82 TaxID=3039159 RepID=UPI0024B0589F|nr:WD40 repeat domain-containing protein [Bradyrhizobium sp. CB82]WFU45508.1 WD40 repeat domain-containing protein [Bradyrhizobium sp. CB82]